MKIKALTITGYDEMVRTMYMTNKKYNDAIERKITYGEFVRKVIADPNISTMLMCDLCIEDYEWYRKRIESAIKLACGSLYAKANEDGSILPEQIQQCHSTVGRFLDISCVVDGLHRGATDDFDAHAKRLDSRIVRRSTRTTSPDDIVLSDYYKGKVIPFGDLTGEVFDVDANKSVKIELPDNIKIADDIYHKSRFGYVHDGYENNYDVLRGLTPLGMSNLFIFKCNITEWAHITRLRRPGTHAAPELQQMIEMINAEIEKKEPLLNDDFWRYCIQ